MILRIDGKDYRTVWWEDDKLHLIDQRMLPHSFEIVSFDTVEGVSKAISDMVVRGAVAIGAAAIWGMVLADRCGMDSEMAKKILMNSRPTAHDLFDAIEHFIGLGGDPEDVARAYCDESVKRCHDIGVCGEVLLGDGARILTHCNAGALGCLDWGTALAPMRVANQNGKKIFVWVDETRPRCQGARLTTWELSHEGIDHALIADNAAGYFMRRGEVDLVIVGADRIAANGDVANKIGTYEKAVLARENGIPFYVAAPSSTYDPDCPTGEHIPIEERGADEITHMWGLNEMGEIGKIRISYPGCHAKNPAFDVTDARYVSGYITEDGIFKDVKDIKCH